MIGHFLCLFNLWQPLIKQEVCITFLHNFLDIYLEVIILLVVQVTMSIIQSIDWQVTLILHKWLAENTRNHCNIW